MTQAEYEALKRRLAENEQVLARAREVMERLAKQGK